MELSGKRDTLKKDGWVIIKNVFSAEEVAQMRQEMSKADKEQYGKGDLLSNPYLSHVVYDDRILKIVTEVLGQKPVYYGDSTFQIASSIGRISNGFHKDCADRLDATAPDWQSEYTIIRVGIYLQDHSKYSEGLVVRTGSHKYIELNKGKMVNVPSQPGDIIVWYLTTSHSGNARKAIWGDFPVLMGDMNVPAISRVLFFHLPKVFIKSNPADRMAMFMSFGVNDNHLKRYIEYLKHRKYAVNIWKNSPYTAETLAKIKDKPLDVISMYETAQQINLDTIGENYKQLPS